MLKSVPKIERTKNAPYREVRIQKPCWEFPDINVSLSRLILPKFHIILKDLPAAHTTTGKEGTLVQKTTHSPCRLWCLSGDYDFPCIYNKYKEKCLLAIFPVPLMPVHFP